tara:strand:+ start:85 stop:483 length:399 start_codon:yes stop_codon:yes gene_type:complete
MNGIGPELPLNRDSHFGNYVLITSYRDEVKQNFKNLLLTAPGERMMNPDFGVGLRHFLFEPRAHSIPKIRQRIEAQVRKYLPFIRINKVQFDPGAPLSSMKDESKVISILIEYDVPNLNISSTLIFQSEEIN